MLNVKYCKVYKIWYIKVLLSVQLAVRLLTYMPVGFHFADDFYSELRVWFRVSPESGNVSKPVHSYMFGLTAISYTLKRVVLETLHEDRHR